MKPTNLVYIISDQHNRNASGCYDHPLIQTPNIDRLAERGTRFNYAYTNCPICVPARASLATGQYVHQIRYWDNAFPYEGDVPSWHHRLRAQGHRVDSVGKLHFRRAEDDLGFTDCVEPLNVVDGIGDVLSCVRKDPPMRPKREPIHDSGPGDSTYLRYDVRNADNACRWLADHANDEKPWVLFLSFVCPHPPYIAPQEFYDLYPLDRVPMMPQWQQEDWPDQPALEYMRRFFGFDPQFDEQTIRKMIAAYYGATSHLDQQIGRVLAAMDDLKLTEETRVIYTSDHGEHMGARGIFGKFTMYEESAAVPFVMAGPDVPVGEECNTAISLVDTFPTVLEAVGATPSDEDAELPGESLWAIAPEPDRRRIVFSEYHAVATHNGYYMVCDGEYKYIHYTAEHSEGTHSVDKQSQLFNLQTDPNEINNLALDTTLTGASLLEKYQRELRAIVDPEAIDALAKADQATKIAEFGGEEAVLQRGFFVNSPTPDEIPAFHDGS